MLFSNHNIKMLCQILISLSVPHLHGQVVQALVVLRLRDRAVFEERVSHIQFITAHFDIQQKLPNLYDRQIRQTICQSRIKRCVDVGKPS